MPNEVNIAYYLNIEIESHTQVNQPDMTTTQDFYKNYSPKKSKLKPRDDIYLDLKIKMKVTNTLEPWINLLASLKWLGLKTEDNDWLSNKTKNDTIQLRILNRSFTKTFEIRKNQVTAFMFLLGQKSADIINTKYTKFM